MMTESLNFMISVISDSTLSNYKLDSYIFIEDNGESLIVGFTDNDIQPTKYVILIKAYEYDEQDIKVGMDKLYIEIDDQSRAYYGGISSFLINQNCLIINLNKKAAKHLAIDNIEIKLDTKHTSFKEGMICLKQIAEDEKIPWVTKG